MTAHSRFEGDDGSAGRLRKSERPPVWTVLGRTDARSFDLRQKQAEKLLEAVKPYLITEKFKAQQTKETTMNEDTEYKDAFDAAAQPAVETAEEPAFAVRTKSADGTALQQTNAADNKAAEEDESKTKMDEMGKLASATSGLSAHTRRAPQTQLEAGRTWPTTGASSIRSPRLSAGNDLPRLSHPDDDEEVRRMRVDAATAAAASLMADGEAVFSPLTHPSPSNRCCRARSCALTTSGCARIFPCCPAATGSWC